MAAPLHDAVSADDPDLVRHTKDNRGRTALDQAREAGYQEVADYLAGLAEGRDVSLKAGDGEAEFGEDFTLRKSEAVGFANGLLVRFLGHSMDSVMIGGYKEPLWIKMEYEQGGKKEKQTHEVYPGNREPWGWNWGGMRFK